MINDNDKINIENSPKNPLYIDNKGTGSDPKLPLYIDNKGTGSDPKLPLYIDNKGTGSDPKFPLYIDNKGTGSDPKLPLYIDNKGTGSDPKFPLYVEVMDKENISTESFDLSKDTKFTVRTLLSYCLFIIAVYGFKLKFHLMGLGLNMDSSTNMLNLAWLSLWLIIIHMAILGIYLHRDWVKLEDKNRSLDYNARIWKERYTLGKDLIKNLENGTESISKYNTHNNKIFNFTEIPLRDAKILIKKICGWMKLSNSAYYYPEVESLRKITYEPYGYVEESIMAKDDMAIDEAFKALDNITKKYDSAKKEYSYYKSRKISKDLILYGINAFYPLFTAGYCLYLLSQYTNITDIIKFIF